MSEQTGQAAAAWYQNAVFYALDVDTFFDSDGDGRGDFQGLIRKLDYLAWLGVDCIWLLPFYPTPNCDNGYDVTDHRAVKPSVGSLRDFDTLVAEARRRDMRVILDLLMDHTSDQHPWFQWARQDPRSRYRDYYVWTTDPDREPEHTQIFPEIEDGVWHWDERAGAYYLHHFYHTQPDLNTANPAVREEVRRIVHFWLEHGVAGFRIDGAPYLKGEAVPTHDDPHPLLRWLRRIVSERAPETLLCAEADVDGDELARYFADGEEVQAQFNFLLSECLFLALARREAEPIRRALSLLPPRPPHCQWLNFLRNLDELDMERLSEAERQQVCRAFAPDPDMQLYERGIRRRLAPMLGGDQRLLELAFSLLFSLPGAPLLVYGDEIGMGEDLSRTERESVRTPMQWTGEPGGGFSTAAREALVAVPIEHGPFGYRQANVEDQRRDRASLLHFVRRLIQARKVFPEIGLVDGEVVETDSPSVFAYAYRAPNHALTIVHNLAAEPCDVGLKGALKGQPKVVLADSGSRLSGGPSVSVQLSGHGYCWFRLG